MRIPMLDASVRRRAAFAALALVVTAAASLAAPGGGYWAAVGGGRVAARKSGVRPAPFPANLRLDFDGVDGDLAGTGSMLAYDELGQNLLHTIPFTWETKNGRTFRLDLDEAAVAPLLEDVLADAADAECTVSLIDASARGRTRLRGEAIGIRIRALGECAIAGGETRVLRATVKAK
jgi:hypothetical protein